MSFILKHWAGWCGGSTVDCGRKVPDLNLGWYTGDPDCGFSLLYSVPSGRYRCSISIRPVSPNSKSFACHRSPVILPSTRIVWALLSVV
jgi:hypothetical protein